MNTPPVKKRALMTQVEFEGIHAQHPDQVRRIAVKRHRLRTLDRRRTLFGANHHGHALGRCRTEAELSAWESATGLTLPAGYHRFLAEVGDGGGGPGYGLIALPDPSDLDLAHLRRPNRLLPRPPGTPQAWPESGTGPPDHRPDQARWDDGAIGIAYYGCLIGGLLIIHGPTAGTVWVDVNQDHLVPAGPFLDWYEAWLDLGLVNRGRLHGQMCCDPGTIAND